MKTKFRRFYAVIIMLLLLAGCQGTDIAQTGETPTNATISATLPPEELEELTVHFLDIGQGDCILLTCGEMAMMIDAGDNNCATKIVLYLKELSIFDLDYVIGTHPDADHIGGLDVVLYRYDCETILMPNYKKDTTSFEEVEGALKTKNYKVVYPEVGDTYTFGDATFQIIAPNSKEYEKANDYSIGIMLTHGENRFLFTGDAEAASEEEMLAGGYDLSADVYKVAHHGSKTSTTEEFFDAVSPTYAVISCGEGNDYGHPHAEVLNRLRSAGVLVYRTDEQGTITVTSDGKELIWNCQPTESWQAGEPGAAPSVTAVPTEETKKEADYILNTSTKKIHLPGCSSVETITAKNREESSLSREELEAEGYEACKRCIDK